MKIDNKFNIGDLVWTVTPGVFGHVIGLRVLVAHAIQYIVKHKRTANSNDFLTTAFYDFELKANKDELK